MTVFTGEYSQKHVGGSGDYNLQLSYKKLHSQLSPEVYGTYQT
jgi:hypothetical protein